MSTLVMRLAGPMQSWGTQSRFSVRDTGLEPSKSGVIGLLCAALGRPRCEPVDDLAGLVMGVRIDREGSMKLDYHTAGGTHRKGDEYGVATADGGKRTVTSNRYYLADADFLVALQPVAGSPEAKALMGKLSEAIACPRWPLYLGRKAFVPGRPVLAGITDEPVEAILKHYPWYARTAWEKQKKLKEAEESGKVSLRVVFDAGFGSTPDVRCDVPLSFAERRFTIRHVRTSWIDLSPDMIKEEPLCTSRA